jgi:SAM-dependent methyltransferase
MDSYERIAPFYDCEHQAFTEDIDFFVNALPEGPVLEIGSGTGRVAAALAAAGYRVTGIDPSSSMLERARQSYSGRPNLTFVQGSLPGLTFPSGFRSAILSLNTLWHLGEQRLQVKALRDARESLDSEGLLFVDLTNPLSMADRGADGTVRQRFRGPCENSLLTVSSAAWDDEAAQILRLELTYDRLEPAGAVARTTASLTLRYIYRAELELMLELAGFRVRDVFGSYEMDPYTQQSENILAVASRS